MILKSTFLALFLIDILTEYAFTMHSFKFSVFCYYMKGWAFDPEVVSKDLKKMLYNTFY